MQFASAQWKISRGQMQSCTLTHTGKHTQDQYQEPSRRKSSRKIESWVLQYERQQQQKTTNFQELSGQAGEFMDMCPSQNLCLSFSNIKTRCK